MLRIGGGTHVSVRQQPVELPVLTFRTIVKNGEMTTAESCIWRFLARYFGPELRAWRGEMSMALVFWGYGVFASCLLAILHVTALDLGQLLFQQVLIVLSALYTLWILVAIWRCAANATPFWGTAARWLTVAWALNTALVLAFLQFDLLVRYATG